MKVVLKGSMKPQKIDHLTSSKQKCQECSSSNLLLFSALYVSFTCRLIQKIIKLLDNADQHEDGCFVLLLTLTY